MKQLLFILLIVSVGWYGCTERNKPATATKAPDFYKGYDFLETNNKDSAFYYFDKFVNSSSDSLRMGIAYYYMATIQFDVGSYFSSQESALESLKYLNKEDTNALYYIHSDYVVLGNNSINLKNYDPAISYFDQALGFAVDDNEKLYALNGKAIAYRDKHEYSKAEAIYSLIIAQSSGNKLEYARILSNMARVKWLQDSTYPALSEFSTALKIRQDEKDDRGLNASYSHLSDYHSRSRRDSALFYAHKMHETATRIKSFDDELEALEKLMKLTPLGGLGRYLNRYLTLRDSLQTARNNAKNQFVTFRYEVEKSKAENLVLQNDIAEKRIQIIWQRIFLLGGFLVFVFGVVAAIIWYRKRKRRMEWESLNIIREEKLKTSQKVHDVVANGLYRIMIDLEHNPSIEKESLTDKIEVLYNKSRDISYEEIEALQQDFPATITELLTSFATQTTKVVVAGGHSDLWEDVKPNIKKELENVLQELMVNMKKHSHAQKVLVKFEKRGDLLKIIYQDDGIGLPKSFRYGNGLLNTENRIKGIGGNIIFEQAATKGLRIQISIPLV